MSKERPVLFSAPMVRALLEGRKTQTRRIVKPQPSSDWLPVVGEYHPTKIDRNHEEYPGKIVFGAADAYEGRVCPYGAPGDQLWVKETWQAWSEYDDDAPSEIPQNAKLLYCADRPDDLWKSKMRPSIFMPRWASRITLDVTEVRVQRLQDITEEDAKAEGLACKRLKEYGHSDGAVYVYGLPGWDTGYEDPCVAYRHLWETINGPGSWDANPWVWCVTFSAPTVKESTR